MSREMKYSGVEWIGEIPENWSTPKVKYHALFFNGDRGKNYPGDDDLQSEGIPFITSNNLHELVLNINPSISKYITNECYNRLGGAKIQLNDILFCLRGSVGICAINKELRDGTVASSLMDVRPVRIDADFLNYYFHSELANAQTIAYMNGSCAANLSAEAVSNYYLLLPTNVTEQQQIVHFLDRKCTAIDTAIEKTKKSIEKLEEYKKAVITKAVTKGIDPNTRMKDSGVEWIGEIPEGWEITRNKFYVIISHGMDPKTEGDIPVYGSGAESFKSCGEYKEGPAVLLGRKGATLHIPHYITGKYWNVDTAFDVKTKSEDMGLKYFYFLSMCFNYNYYIAKTTLPSMTQFDYCNMRIPLPSRKEQDIIVSYIEDKCVAIDTAIEKKKKAIEKWEEYKKSLIYYAVTGKIDCRNEVI